MVGWEVVDFGQQMVIDKLLNTRFQDQHFPKQKYQFYPDYIINILQDCKCANFTDDLGKQSWGWLSIVSEEHEVITELREICLDSLPRLSIRLKCWSPIHHVQATWNFQIDAYRRKQVLL